MRISEITATNKPYIRIVKGKKKVDIPITPKLVVLPPGRSNLRKAAYVGCDTIRVHFKGKVVKINWTFNHHKMTLYCSSGRKAYSWSNVKVTTITGPGGKKEHLIVCKKAYGDETERRRFKRFPIVKNITVSQGDKKYPATTVDISYAGVGFVVKSNATINPTEPIVVDFGGEKPVRVRLVRTVYRDDGSELFGCRISNVYRYDMIKLINQELPSAPTKERDPMEGADAGWKEKTIKKWH